MNCEATHALLSAYVDGQLDEADRRRVEAHLSACAHCRAEAAALRQTIASIAGLPAVEPPPGFSQRVMAHAREEARQTRGWRSLFFPLWAKIPLQAAAVLLIGGLAVYLYQTNEALRTVENEMHEIPGSSAPAPSEEQTLTAKTKLDQMAKKPAAPPAPAQSPARREDFKDEPKLPATQDADRSLAYSQSPIGRSIGDREATLEERGKKAPLSTTHEGFAGLISTLLKTPNEHEPSTEIIMTVKPSAVDDPGKQLGELAVRMGGTYEPVNHAAISKQNIELLRKVLPSAGYANTYSAWLIIPHLQYPKFKSELTTLGTIDSLGDPALAQERYRIKVIILIPKPQ